MNIPAVRKAAEKDTISAMVKYALRAETDIEDEDIRNEIKIRAANALIYGNGEQDTVSLSMYLRSVALFADVANEPHGDDL